MTVKIRPLPASLKIVINIGSALLLAILFLQVRLQAAGGDLPYYSGVGTRMLQASQGSAVHIDSEYPFLANMFSMLVQANIFHVSFVGSWAIGLAAATIMTIMFFVGWLTSEKAHWILPSIVITALLFHPLLLFGRFDMLVGLALLLLWKSHTHGMHRNAGLLLVVAIFLKLLPIFLLPLLWVTRTGREKMLFVQGALIGCVAITTLAAVTIGIPEFIESSTFFIRQRAEHPVQVESTLSGIDMLMKHMAGGTAKIEHVDFSYWNADLPPIFSRVLLLAIMAGMCVFAGIAWRRGIHGDARFDLLFLGSLLWMLFCIPVFSPQYQWWVLPLLIFWLLSAAEDRGGFSWDLVAIGIVVVLAGLGSSTVYPNHYSAFLGQESLALILWNNIRNFSLLVLMILIVKRLRGAAPPTKTVSP